MPRGQRPRPGVVRVAVVLSLLVWPLARNVVDLDAAPPPSARDRALHIVRAVQSAQSTYRSVHGYYDRLECLVQDSCVPNPYPPTYLVAGAMRAVAYGYRFRLTEGPRVRVTTSEFVSGTGMSAYAFTGVPNATDGPQGPTSFCADAEGVYEYADGREPAVRAGRCLDRTTPVP